MVSAEYVIVACVELERLLSGRVVLEKDPITIAGSLGLLILVFIVVHISLVGRFKINCWLKIARVLLRKVQSCRLATGKSRRYHASLA